MNKMYPGDWLTVAIVVGGIAAIVILMLNAGVLR
jgi:hypothetical protein